MSQAEAVRKVKAITAGVVRDLLSKGRRVEAVETAMTVGELARRARYLEGKKS